MWLERKIVEKRCFNQWSRKITTVRRCKIIPFRQITQPNNSRSNYMRTLLNENLVFALKRDSHLGEFNAGAFPGPELWSCAQGLPSARGTSWVLLRFFFWFTQPDCILEVRQDAPDVSSGSLIAQPGVRVWGCLPYPATGSAGQKHSGLLSGLHGCCQLQQGTNGDRST